MHRTCRIGRPPAAHAAGGLRSPTSSRRSSRSASSRAPSRLRLRRAERARSSTTRWSTGVILDVSSQTRRSRPPPVAHRAPDRSRCSRRRAPARRPPIPPNLVDLLEERLWTIRLDGELLAFDRRGGRGQREHARCALHPGGSRRDRATSLFAPRTPSSPGIRSMRPGPADSEGFRTAAPIESVQRIRRLRAPAGGPSRSREVRPPRHSRRASPPEEIDARTRAALRRIRDVVGSAAPGGSRGARESRIVVVFGSHSRASGRAEARARKQSVVVTEVPSRAAAGAQFGS